MCKTSGGAQKGELWRLSTHYKISLRGTKTLYIYLVCNSKLLGKLSNMFLSFCFWVSRVMCDVWPEHVNEVDWIGKPA